MEYFWDMPDIPDIFLGLTVDAGSKPTYQEKIEYPLGQRPTSEAQFEVRFASGPMGPDTLCLLGISTLPEI